MKLLNVRTVHVIFVLWYLVGISGFMIVPLRSYFQALTPFGMVVSAGLLLYFHEPKNPKSWLVFSGIALFGFVIELIGVNTRLVFGEYTYGETLGLKIWNTPLTIGLNWLILTYCIASLVRGIRDRWYFPLVGASAMLIFDWIMEPVAVATGMWSWANGSIPLKNYADWFLVSGFLFLGIRLLKVELNNRVAAVLLVMQLIFFLTLNLLIRTPLWGF